MMQKRVQFISYFHHFLHKVQFRSREGLGGKTVQPRKYLDIEDKDILLCKRSPLPPPFLLSSTCSVLFCLGAISSFVVLYFPPCLHFLVIIFMKHTFSLCPVNLGPITVFIALLPHGACPQFSVSVIVIIYY